MGDPAQEGLALYLVATATMIKASLVGQSETSPADADGQIQSEGEPFLPEASEANWVMEDHYLLHTVGGTRAEGAKLRSSFFHLDLDVSENSDFICRSLI